MRPRRATGRPCCLPSASASASLCGAFNGFLVTCFGLPSIVVTIGTMSLFRGITQVILGDQAMTKYPRRLPRLGQSYFIKMKETGISWLFIPPLPLSFLIFLVLASSWASCCTRRRLGRQLYAIGSNPVAARFSGIPVDAIRFMLFVLSGILSGLAAALLTARIGSTRSNIALGWELDIVTMVILGGVSIAGGVGSILGRRARRLRARPRHLRHVAQQHPGPGGERLCRRAAHRRHRDPAARGTAARRAGALTGAVETPRPWGVETHPGRRNDVHLKSGASDGARTRDLRRDRPAL